MKPFAWIAIVAAFVAGGLWHQGAVHRNSEACPTHQALRVPVVRHLVK